MVLGVALAAGVAAPLAAPAVAQAQVQARWVLVYDVYYWNGGQWVYYATYDGAGDATRALIALQRAGYFTYWGSRWVWQ
jgi:hypothetical protein